LCGEPGVFIHRKLFVPLNPFAAPGYEGLMIFSQNP
jgi:hypothetical protein